MHERKHARAKGRGVRERESNREKTSARESACF